MPTNGAQSVDHLLENTVMPHLALISTLSEEREKACAHPHGQCSIIYKGQDMEATVVPTDRWMDKNVLYRHNAILLSHKKERNAICSNTDGLRDNPITWSKSERHYHVSLTCGITNELIYETDSQTHGCQGRGWEWERDWMGVWG